MTFCPDVYQLWYKEYPMFTQWSASRGILFPPKESAEDADNQFSLTSKAYILMKRLGQDYDTILQMDADERDLLFTMEMELIKKESEHRDKNNFNG